MSPLFSRIILIFSVRVQLCKGGGEEGGGGRMEMGKQGGMGEGSALALSCYQTTLPPPPSHSDPAPHNTPNQPAPPPLEHIYVLILFSTLPSLPSQARQGHSLLQFLSIYPLPPPPNFLPPPRHAVTLVFGPSRIPHSSLPLLAFIGLQLQRLKDHPSTQTLIFEEKNSK